MQTARTLDKWTYSEDRSRLRAIGANLIIIGAVAALAASALLILMADSGGQLPTSRAATSAVVDTSPPAAASPADQDRSWLCNVISDDSAPESQVAAKESLTRAGITCAEGLLLDTQPAADK